MWQWTEKDNHLTKKELEAVQEFLNYDIICGQIYEKGGDKYKVVFIRYPYGTINKSTRSQLIDGIWHYRTPYAFPDEKEVSVCYQDLDKNETVSVSGSKFVEWYKGGVNVVKEESSDKMGQYVENKKKAIISGAVETKPYKTDADKEKGNWRSPIKKKKS